METQEEMYGDVLCIEPLEDRLDAVAAPRFKKALVAHIEAGVAKVVLDLSRVRFVDSSGLGALVTVLKRMPPDCRLVLCGMNDAVLNMFRLTSMDRVFAVVPDRAEAITSIAVAGAAETLTEA